MEVEGEEEEELQTKQQWELLCPKSFSGVELSPTAIEDYAYSFSVSKKPDNYLSLLVRKQLSLLDWKIERLFHRNSFRYRYTSPNSGKVYLSLNLLCDEIINSSPIAFDSVKKINELKSRKRKERDNHNVDDDDDESSVDSLSSELTELKSEEEVKSCRKKLKPVPPIRQRNFGPGILCSLIDNNLVAEGAKVHYRRAKSGGDKKLTEGRITRGGIECDCCQRIFALTKFEAHAGSTNHRPAANILLEDGRSLADCQRQLEGDGSGLLQLNLPKKKPRKMLRKKPKPPKMLKLKLKITGNQNSTDDKGKKRGRKKKKKKDNEENSYYMCSVCRQEGDLILCDDCPSAFHKICLGIKDLPLGHWSCPFCCCDYCGCRKFNNSFVRKDGYILRCENCPVKVHVGCAKDRGMNCERDKNVQNPVWFCSEKCRDIYSNVQNLIGQSIVIGEDNLTWTLLKRKWPPKSSENNKLNLALEVLHECFDPVTEFYTGRDLVEDVIFSKRDELHRMNFRRFYTILVEKDNEPVSVANLRISGEKVAEVPLVATRFEYRRLGMCKKLMDELEKQLIRLGVQKLVLPSATTTLQTWTHGFGFLEMTEAERKQYFQYNFLDFQGTIMCHKLLTKIQ